MPDIAYVCGKWVPLSKAVVSVEDRGFQFGDGVYEVIRTYGTKVFHLDDHIKRLYRSARQIQISPSETASEIAAIVHAGCKKSGYQNVKIYIQITRGAAPRAHPFPKGASATTVLTFREFDPISPRLREKGVSVISTEDIRWSRCNVKSLNLLPNVLAREQAVKARAYEAIFVRNGFVWEGAGSNIFAVFGQNVVTPPEGAFVLSGITRDQVIKLGRRMGIAICEANLPLADLYRADEIFLTGTTVEILPVVRLDKKSVGTGRPGPMTSLLYQAFQKALKNPENRDRNVKKWGSPLGY